MTDIGFSGTAGGGGAGVVPDDVVFATDPGEMVDLPPPAIDNFGSGAVFDFTFAGDADYNPALQVTSGEGYGAGVHVGFIALTGYAPGFAAGYETLNFKVKDLPAGTIEVKFIEGGDTSIVYDVTTYSGSENLGNGWYQVTIPMTDFAATIAANQGFILGPLGDQGASFSFLLTDIGFSGTAGGGGADPGTIPEAVVYATDPSVVEDLAPAGVDNFGSGAVFEFNFAGDADFDPSVQVTSGEGYGAGVHVGFVAFTGYAAGFASGYGTFDFKAKINDISAAVPFEVKFIEGGDSSQSYDLTTYAGSTALGNDWYQVSIPMSDFAATIAANQGFLLGPAGGQAGPFTMLLTDIGFSGTAGGGSSGCAPVGSELATNGDFEAGDLSCWEAIPNGGTITADNTENNGGTWSAHVVTAGASNPTLKQNFLAEGTVAINDIIDISFDMKGTAGAGGVIFPKLISEGAVGSEGPILQTIDVPTAGWTTYTYSPTITADVTRGITFEISVVCGAVAGCIADVFIDNVSVQIR